MIKKFIWLEGWSHTLSGFCISIYIHIRTFPSNFCINGHWNLLGRVIEVSRPYRNGISTLVDAPYHASDREKCPKRQQKTTFCSAKSDIKLTWKIATWRSNLRLDRDLEVWFFEHPHSTIIKVTRNFFFESKKLVKETFCFPFVGKRKTWVVKLGLRVFLEEFNDLLPVETFKAKRKIEHKKDCEYRAAPGSKIPLIQVGE